MVQLIGRIHAWHRPLALFAASMAVLAAVSVVGCLSDDRILAGVPIWAKPLKFSISFVLYALTLAWMVSRLRRPGWRRFGRRSATVLAVASSLEMTAIVVQVVRGRQSHFNVATPFDSVVFAVMGVLVGIIQLSTMAVAVALLVESPLADRAGTWAVRLGLGISIAGLSVGFLMLAPTPQQLAQGGDAPLRGAHGVGAVDGGPSIPVLGWSTTGGDLRVAHFVGMHALQVLPLVALALTVLPAARRWSSAARTNAVLLAAAGYTGVFALTLWQALRGQSLIGPDAATLAVAGGLVLLLVCGGVRIARTARGPDRVTV